MRFSSFGGFCFVGCKLDTKGTEFPPFTEYGRRDVLENTSLLCIAYWPLKEPSGALKAIDLKGGHNGDYKDVGNAGSLFPCPDFTYPNGQHSPIAGGTLVLGQTNIVTGETKPPHDVNNVTFETGMTTDGGFVIVPATETVALNPLKAFSVELWARPEFSGSELSIRELIDSRDVQAERSGFSIGIRDGLWEASFGTGVSAAFQFITGPAFEAEKASHVVLTYDGVNGNLFVNGELVKSEIVDGFVPNTTQPLTIGVGLKRLPDRVQDASNVEPRFPLFPFKGTLQCVAIYETALLLSDVKKHFHDGQGLKDEENA